ncbi:MAG: tryptophan synthase subunit alpha, partial [Pirellulaceae bacterium]|nr:tryptophan synthase subunit alpha [Pirellulaceae bacterium]
MSAIDQLFSELKQQGRKALMPFVTAGDPDVEFTAALIRELAARGATMCEIGIPYSDPIADGPVIQASYTRALDNHVKLADIVAMLGEVTSGVTMPIVTMISYAIIHRHGLERYVTRAKAAGVA